MQNVSGLCPYFCHLRKRFLKPEHIRHANAKITMKHILTSDNIEELIDLSKFTKHILDKFAEQSVGKSSNIINQC